MKTLMRIIIGEVPEPLRDCIASQERFAERSGMQIETISEIPEKYRDFDLRTATEYMRIEYLIENPRTLYCDWDIYLDDNFAIPDKAEYYYGSFFDSLLYNGNNITIFKNIFDLMQYRIEDRKFEEGIVFKAFLKLGIDKSKILTNYKHLAYTQAKGHPHE